MTGAWEKTTSITTTDRNITLSLSKKPTLKCVQPTTNAITVEYTYSWKYICEVSAQQTHKRLSRVTHASSKSAKRRTEKYIFPNAEFFLKYSTAPPFNVYLSRDRYLIFYININSIF